MHGMQRVCDAEARQVYFGHAIWVHNDAIFVIVFHFLLISFQTVSSTNWYVISTFWKCWINSFKYMRIDVYGPQSQTASSPHKTNLEEIDSYSSLSHTCINVHIQLTWDHRSIRLLFHHRWHLPRLTYTHLNTYLYLSPNMFDSKTTSLLALLHFLHFPVSV